MQIKTLYRYQRQGGGVDVSPVMPSGVEFETLYRLTAGDGAVLVNGETETECVDTDTPEEWREETREIEQLAEAARILLGEAE